MLEFIIKWVILAILTSILWAYLDHKTGGKYDVWFSFVLPFISGMVITFLLLPK